MFLKSLEIRGFKSFADKTLLNFDKGITAVVGPNGSGKSNVSDAVRWVLGEQSARVLRGAKMEDIIFTGTEYRKPIGIASVSLTLDNSDESLPIEFNEVKVTRRIYRSGESEYLINNSSCRLKDIVNLFMDTGIGKEGYSLIGQGKIDAILSGKTEDRRALLEEAAGIVKYKTRKLDAERKLKNTADNLVRIDDIVLTYQERIEPLETEKNKAEKYLMLSSELKAKDINLLVNNLVTIDDEVQEKKNILNDLESEGLKVKNSLLISKENLRKFRDELEKIEVDNKKQNDKYIEKKEFISAMNAEIALLEERIKNYKNSKKSLEVSTKIKESKKEEIKSFLLNIEKKIFDDKESLTKLEGLLNNFSLENTKILNDLNLKEKERDTLKQEDLDSIKKESEYKSQKTILENNIDILVENLNTYKINIQDLESKIKISNLTKVKFENQIKDVLKEIDTLNLEHKSTGTIVKELKDNILILNKDKDSLKSIINKIEANKNVLKNLESSYEGYNVSVKKLIQRVIDGKIEGVLKNNFYVLGEILNTEKGYEIAIETALGNTISNIITENENIAKLMINHLKVNKLGRATFLPLTIIKSKGIEVKNISENDGYLGLASNLVRADKKFNEIINYVLGRTLICKDIDSALNVAKKLNYKYRIVTLDGEIINAGGALTGGSYASKNIGVISRKKQIDDLSKNLAVKLNDLKKISLEQEEKTNKVNALINQNNDIEQNLRKNDFEVASLTKDIKRIDDEILRLRLSYKNILIQVKDSEDKKETYLSKLVKMKNEYDVVVKNKSNNSERLLLLENDIKEMISKKDIISGKITDLKVESSTLKQIIVNKDDEIKKNKKMLFDLDIEISNLAKKIIENDKQINASKNIILENNNKIVLEQEYISEVGEQNKKFEVYKGKIKESINKVETNVELITLDVAKREEDINKNKILLARIEAQRFNFTQKLEDDYEVNVDEALEKYEKIENLEKYKASIYSLKTKMNSLGTVNVNAIQEFKELSEKYKFLISEKSDLENARDELISIIEEMTSQMRIIFRQNFNILNNNFDITFKELFKGGSAKLILDENDELSGDIVIRVQPPGKKIQNINLMSGGEKVLSAIALLFAILRMKPTPFCILDEIEAALDDANVSRYASFLSQFSDNIQFIVITHRKGTMEKADIMYGVTMEEKGISKIVSVDLNKK